MADLKEIHDFAVKWCDKFRDQNISYLELTDHFMADDCAALGFDMIDGHTFFENYGQAANNHEALDKIIDNVTDIPLLGSAIYSRWRSFNHSLYSGEEILQPQNRAWFILALSRLALLSGENPFIFQGTLKKMRILSKNICNDYILSDYKEMEQHLAINDEGYVCFSGYNFGHDGEQYEKVRNHNIKIEKASIDRLFGAVSAYFSTGYDEIFATDIGDWLMELTNTDGKTYQFRGSLSADFDYEGTDLSDLVRETVGIDDLFVFDGNRKQDIITKIVLDYHRVTNIKPGEKSDGETLSVVTRAYNEHLIIDRETETLEYIQNIGTGCTVSRKYEIEGGIKSLLDNFLAEDLFSHIEGNSADVIETPNDIKDYTITIHYKKKPERIIEGSYDKNGLPADFANFAEKIYGFICFYRLGDIFDPSVYGKVKRRQSDYIYCSVIFDGGYKSYYYLTDDDSIDIGDFVIVPAGKENREAVVEVVNVEYFNEVNMPWPIEETKTIIRKCTEEDIDQLFEEI